KRRTTQTAIPSTASRRVRSAFVLEECSGCGVSGWGWHDGGWGIGNRGPALYLAQTGAHTIRVQARENGFAIDQIIVSSSKWLNDRPFRSRSAATRINRRARELPSPTSRIVKRQRGNYRIAGREMRPSGDMKVAPVALFLAVSVEVHGVCQQRAQ